MSTSRKILATVDTADFSDCAKTGYTYTLYADGRVAAEYHSRWQGSRDGARYTTEPGAVDLSDLGDDVDHDAESILTAWIEGDDPAMDAEYGRGRTWRRTRQGHVVQ